MTTQSQANESVYKRFAAVWGDETDYTFEGEEYKPAEDSEWVRVAVRHFPTIQQTIGAIGSRKYDRQAAAIIQIFTPLGKGRARADALADLAKTVFEGIAYENLDFYQASVGPEQEMDGAWYMVVVTTNFIYNETK